MKRLAEARGCYVRDLSVVVLDRPRHDSLIDSVVMRSQSGTVRYLTTHHRFDYAPEY